MQETRENEMNPKEDMDGQLLAVACGCKFRHSFHLSSSPDSEKSTQ